MICKSWDHRFAHKEYRPAWSPRGVRNVQGFLNLGTKFQDPNEHIPLSSSICGFALPSTRHLKSSPSASPLRSLRALLIPPQRDLNAVLISRERLPTCSSGLGIRACCVQFHRRKTDLQPAAPLDSNLWVDHLHEHLTVAISFEPWQLKDISVATGMEHCNVRGGRESAHGGGAVLLMG